MARLGVPRQYVASIRRLGEMDAEVLDKIVAQLGEVTSVADLREALVTATGADPGECGEMVAALLAMAQVRRARHESPDAFAEQLSLDDDLSVPADGRDAFVGNLTVLLGTTGVKSLGRAADVSTEHEKVFIDSRILTDLRPIFPREADDESDPVAPEGVVMVHSLKIGYQQDGVFHQFYVALDDLDLELLISTLQRATRKAEGLRELLGSTDITEFSLGGE